MQFQLLNIIIWPKITDLPPRLVSFEPGKLNIITGASRTGKSAIIPIIDYCLASGDCNIPIDTIRDYSSWYGVIFQTNDDQILLCRKVPEGNKASSEFYFQRAKVLSIPPQIKEGNEKTEGIKHILNSISSVPYLNLSEEEKQNYKGRLSFRDLMALVFQSQDIVANQNILFYKTHAHEHREKLRNWFPFILGAETTETLIARQRLQLIEQRLNQLQKEYLKVKAVSDSWLANMTGHLKVAKEYGLYNYEISPTMSVDDMIEAAKGILEEIPNFSQSTSEDIESANKEFDLLETQETSISSDIAVTKKRLNDLNNLKAGFLDYGNAVRKRIDRLHISKWLQDVASEATPCPACGSSEHPNTNTELTKISRVFEKYEAESKNVAEVPTSFIREEERLNAELEDLLSKKKALQERFDLLINRDKKAQEEFQRRKNMYLFIGHFKASFETFEKLADGGSLQEEIAKLEEERETLLPKVDTQSVKRRLEVATGRIAYKILSHLKSLDVEDKYREIPPRLEIENLSISVLSNDEHWHFLAQVGSASNWVSFHIALMCALQEFFIELPNSSVPSFVIFDQPSQVYFPKLRRGESIDVAGNLLYRDEDVDAVKMIFKTISNSILTSAGKWQGIVLDHADDTIYGDIVGVHEVEVWRGGNKLIPESWINYRK